MVSQLLRFLRCQLFLVFTLYLQFPPAAVSDLSADRAALLRLRDAVGGRTRRWKATSPTPCAWEGVTCDASAGRVVSLRLPADGLSGRILPQTIGALTELRNLSLRRNSLSGTIPPDLGSCTNLQVLYLQENRFSGEIPAGLFGLRNLSVLNLANNNFSGNIPANFNNLSSLRALNLENNQFSGFIPDLDNLSNLRWFNVSFNNLSGPIPSSLSRFFSQSFLGNSLCNGPLNACPDNGGRKSKLSGGAIAGIAIGSSFGLTLLLIIVFALWSKCGKRQLSRQNEQPKTPPSPVKQPEYDFRSPRPFISREDRYDQGWSNYQLSGQDSANGSSRVVEQSANSNGGIRFVGSSVEAFSLDELLRASAEVLGKGNVGTTYKAYVETGNEAVVKRLKNVCVSEEEFRERIEELGTLKHENLVPIMGYFYGKEEKLLLYDSTSMRSLHSALHDSKGTEMASLTWVIRCRIALGIANGIEYLHSLGSNMSHGNIKSSNIFLKQYYDACVSEYGIIALVSPVPTSRAIGYSAPEVVDSRKISHKADVYSFGVLILELLTGKEPIKALGEEGIDLPRWTKSVVQEQWTIEVFDPELLKHQNSSEEQMVRLLHLAISCTSQFPHKRPSMKEVTTRIREISGIPH